MSFMPFSTVVWTAPSGRSTVQLSESAVGFPQRLSHASAVRIAKHPERTFHGFRPMCIVNAWPKGEKNPFRNHPGE